jgi:hypothetical protein
MASLSVLVILMTASGCRDSNLAPNEAPLCVPDHVCVTGAVHFFGIEGGFWAIRGDDNVTYDPRDGLPAEFQHDGLRVYLVAKERRDLLGFHQVGPIVEIVEIRQLR